VLEHGLFHPFMVCNDVAVHVETWDEVSALSSSCDQVEIGSVGVALAQVPNPRARPGDGSFQGGKAQHSHFHPLPQDWMRLIILTWLRGGVWSN
jgi:hypothetical protein